MRVLSLQSSRRRQVDRAPRSFYTLYCALTTSENHTRRLQTPPLHLRLTITHPLVFAYFCFHPRSHSGSLALSHKEEAEMGSKFTSQGSRATRNRSTLRSFWVFRTEFCAEHRTNQVTFGRNVLICSNLSYCHCFEKNRSFIAKVDLPRISINAGALVCWASLC